MRPTGWRILLTLGVGGTVVGWFFARMLDNRRGALSLPPWSAGVVLTACGIAADLHRSTDSCPAGPPSGHDTLAAPRRCPTRRSRVAGSRAGAARSGASTSATSPTRPESGDGLPH